MAKRKKTIPAYSLSQIAKLKPCEDTFADVKALKLGRGKITARQAVEAGVTLPSLIKIASGIAGNNRDVERRLRLWLADTATHVLHFFEKERPADMRPREAIIAARLYMHDEIDAVARKAARDAAWAAASDAASDAVRAAALAAARAAGGVTDWVAARVSALAAALAAAWDAEDAGWDVARDAEEKWQRDRLVYWLSEENPQDLPLPKTQTSRAVA